MKRVLLPLVGVGLILIAGSEVLGRGGGGGGRGGGGGGGARAGGGGGGAARSPSLSGGGGAAARPGGGAAAARPSTGAVNPRPATPNTGAISRPNTGAVTRPNGGAITAGANRPSTADVGKFLDMTGPATGAVGAGGNFFEAGGAAPRQLPAGGAGIAGRTGSGEIARPNVGPNAGARGNLANNRPDRIENRGDRQQNRQQRRDQVRDQVRNNHPRLDFWSQYPNWAAWRINRPYRWATWGAVTGWFGAGWSDPVYYNYGDNVYYSGDQVVYGDQPAATAQAYADQAQTIAASAPTEDPQNSEWMPLGVFAVTQDGPASGADPTIFIQLAVSKSAVINGLVQDSATGDTQAIQGKVDKTTQRAAWQYQGKQFPVMETGIYNLTQDTAPALVHFANGQTQQWLLVRLPEPQQGSQTPPAGQ